jgi:hypothetical protein
MDGWDCCWSTGWIGVVVAAGWGCGWSLGRVASSRVGSWWSGLWSDWRPGLVVGFKVEFEVGFEQRYIGLGGLHPCHTPNVTSHSFHLALDSWLQMSNFEYLIHFAIDSIQRVTDQLDHLVNDLLSLLGLTISTSSSSVGLCNTSLIHCCVIHCNASQFLMASIMRGPRD